MYLLHAVGRDERPLSSARPLAVIRQRHADADLQLRRRHAIGFIEHDAAVAFELEHLREQAAERIDQGRLTMEIHRVLPILFPVAVDADRAAAAGLGGDVGVPLL